LISALIAVFLVIVVGLLARRFLIRDEAAWQGAERVTYYLLIPALLIETLAKARLGEVPVLPVAGALIAANLLMGGALLALRGRMAQKLAIDGPAFTSIFQGIMRWNAFVGLAIVGNLYGNLGVTLISIAFAVIIPILNVQSIWILRRYGSGTGGSMTRGLLTNPFIIGTMIGLAINFAGLSLPPPLSSALDIVGRCALGLGLLLVGAGLRLGDFVRPSPALMIGVAARLLVIPVIGALAALALGLSGAALGAVIICLAVPSASASYILARQMGGDAPLMAAILTAQTLFSFATMPLLFLIFGL
jgi:malonate transporter